MIELEIDVEKRQIKCGDDATAGAARNGECDKKKKNAGIKNGERQKAQDWGRKKNKREKGQKPEKSNAQITKEPAIVATKISFGRRSNVNCLLGQVHTSAVDSLLPSKFF